MKIEFLMPQKVNLFTNEKLDNFQKKQKTFGILLNK